MYNNNIDDNNIVLLSHTNGSFYDNVCRRRTKKKQHKRIPTYMATYYTECENFRDLSVQTLGQNSFIVS